MTTYNVSDSFVQIINMLSDLFFYCFDFLKSVEFLGTNLLSFSIAIVVLSAFFSVIFAVASTNTKIVTRDIQRSSRDSFRKR